jgi:hypothetical protein
MHILKKRNKLFYFCILIALIPVIGCNNAKYRYFNVCAASDTIGIYNPYEGGMIKVSSQDSVYDRICSFLTKTDTQRFSYYQSDLKLHTETVSFTFFKKGMKIHEITMIFHTKNGWIMEDSNKRYVCPKPEIALLMDHVRLFTYHHVYGDENDVRLPRNY